MHIDVCIATYKRPRLLTQLLRDVRAQQLPAGVMVHTIVVDNDPFGSAHPVATSFQVAGMSLQYLTQRPPNIALARNHALVHTNGDLIAFIDDDESAPSGWLAALLSTMEHYAADVVFGPVVGLPPADAPSWILEGRFFEPPALPTGTRVHVGGTGNALVKSSIVRGKVSFDPRFGRTGGEDTAFFYSLWRAGAIMVWCQEAQLTECLPVERLTMRYLLERGFGAGQRYADIIDRPDTGLPRARWFAKRASLAVAGSVLAASCIPLRRAWAMRYAIKAATNLGQISTLFPYRHELYRH